MLNRRKEVLNKLKEFNEWFTNKDIDFDKQAYLNTLNELKSHLSNPISVPDFLGWEEDQVYQKDKYQYILRNNKVYRKSLETREWCLIYDMNLLVALQEATKIRFYLQLPILNKEESYLNYDKRTKCIIFSTDEEDDDFQTIFTESEIMKLEEKYDTDLSYLKRIPVEE